MTILSLSTGKFSIEDNLVELSNFQCLNKLGDQKYFKYKIEKRANAIIREEPISEVTKIGSVSSSLSYFFALDSLISDKATILI